MKLTDINYVKELMRDYGVVFQKKYGQNFLINPSIPQRIAEECGADEKSGIIEIGPGIGTMTTHLCEHYQKVVAIEIDNSLIPILAHTLSGYINVKVINDDVMKIDLAELIEREFKGMNVSVCANLPYYITTPILMLLLESRISLDNVTIMIQKEVADRICAKPGTSEYGAITTVVNYYGKAEKLFHVSAGSFMPVPNVDSTVIRINLYKEPPVQVQSEKLLFRVIKAAFAQRRKTLLNALTSDFSNISKSDIANIINICKFKADIRGERLSINDFALLANNIQNLTV